MRLEKIRQQKFEKKFILKTSDFNFADIPTIKNLFKIAGEDNVEFFTNYKERKIILATAEDYFELAKKYEEDDILDFKSISQGAQLLSKEHISSLRGIKPPMFFKKFLIKKRLDKTLASKN